jgi:ribonucleoside-diphosphate reductase alpha chain
MTNQYVWHNDLSKKFLVEGDYLLKGQSLEERVTIICDNAERILGIPGFSQKFHDYFKRGFYSFSTPVWTNFGHRRGLPISCFGANIDDTMDSITFAWAEASIMSKYGGGTSAFFGNLRPRGSAIQDNGQSAGPVHFMRAFDTLIEVVNQGSTRRGSCAAYLPIEHPDIMEFLGIQSEGNPIQKLSFGVTVTDDFMNRMIEGDKKARKVWARVLEVRKNIGFPYIIFIDNANNSAPGWYKGLISHSNLCTEIFLPDTFDESFVCDLSSMNILHYDEWKDTDAVEMLVYFLDAVMTEFIEKARGIRFMERAVKFAERHRALGIGWLGWHSYLQSRMIPFESLQAKLLNVEIAKNIHERAVRASERLAVEYGIPDFLRGKSGQRNATLSAIAPTKSSAFILGQVSEGIEPFRTNYDIKDLAKGKFSIKNPYLESLLERHKRNSATTWKSILGRGGSCQHLDFLDEDEKAVFKTMAEIPQKELVIQASARQKYVDQGQSLNLMIHPSVPVKDINALMIEGWKLGIKSFYYQHSVNAAQEFSRKILECSSCES